MQKNGLADHWAKHEVHMYKTCERCQFQVPVKNALCHVCGSPDFVTVAAQSENGLAVRCQSMVSNLALLADKIVGAPARSINETCHRLISKVSSVKKIEHLVAEPEDRAQTVHRCVGSSGRSIEFAPVFSTEQHHTVESFRELLADDLVKVTGVAGVPRIEKTEPVTLLSTVITSAENTIDIAGLEALKENLHELQGWFESFGKDGILIKTVTPVALEQEAA